MIVISSDDEPFHEPSVVDLCSTDSIESIKHVSRITQLLEEDFSSGDSDPYIDKKLLRKDPIKRKKQLERQLAKVFIIF
jgi:hypothetical protein